MISNHVLIRRSVIGAVAGLLLVSACSNESDSTIATAGDRRADTSLTGTTPAPSTEVDGPVPDAAAEPTTTPASSTGTNPATTDPAATDPAASDPATTDPATTDPAPSADPEPSIDPTTTDPTATDPAAPAPVTSVPQADSAPIDAVDVPDGTVFGVGVYDAVDVDVVAAEVSVRLGPAATDTGWQPMADQFNCAGSTEFRVLWWGDFRMTFERYEADGVVRDELSAWTVGDPTLFELAPAVDAPASSPSNIVTLEGIGLGSTLAEVGATWANLHNGSDGRRVAIDRGGALLIGFDDGDRVVGFGDGPFDCPVDELR